MILLHRLRSILYWIFRRDDVERSLDAELRSYLEIAAAEKVREGMSADDARRRALAELGGGLDHAKERVRAERHGAALDKVWRDIRMAFRSLAATPRFTVVALLTLMLTIGGITTIFTLVDSVILRPLPYPESGRFVELSSVELGEKPDVPAEADFLDWRQRARAFDFLAGYAGGGGVFDEGGMPKQIGQWGITPDMLPMLGVVPILGRSLRPDDFIPKLPEVLLISHALWQSHYGGSPDAIGKKVSVSGRPLEIIGVTPPGFALPGISGSGWAVWGPLRYEDPPFRQSGSIAVIGRLATGATMTTARTEMTEIAAQLAREHPDTNSERTVQVSPLLDNIVGDSRRILWLFFASVSCVLLIGLANLTNLQGIRNAQRQRELSIRAALGAGRGHLVRQLLIESVLLSLLGGIAGSGAAWVATKLLVTAIPSRFPRIEQISVDTRVLFFAIGVSAIAGICFGLIPALRASRSDLVSAMNAGRTLTVGVQRGRTQRVLIVLETALALVLLVTGGLLANSLWKTLTVESGLKEKDLWTFEVSLPFSAQARSKTYWDSALRRLRAMPAIESVALGEGNVFHDNHGISRVVPDGAEIRAPEGFSLKVAQVSGDYFASIGAQVIAGRGILDTDNSSSEPVVVLNESAAKLFWPGEEALGKKVKFTRAMRVVGVVRDYQNNDLNLEILPQMYRSVNQVRPESYGTFFVRTAGGAPLAAAIKDVLSSIEPKTAVTAATAENARWSSLTDQRFRTAILLAFAAAATLLALVGIWGVVSYSVTQRNREVALRIALGATHSETVLLMARHALVPAACGLVLGTLASLWLTRFVEAYLFKVTPTDPFTFAAIATFLSVAAIAASILPARRAALMDPMAMLRGD